MTTSTWEDFPPHVLREYALLADGERGALVGPRGDISWLCAPRWDSAAAFAALVGGTGVYAISAADPSVWGGSYEPGTLIWRSRWVTTSQQIECREALAYPGDPHRVVLLRQIQAIDGDAAIKVVLDVRAGFGASPMHDLARDDRGVWTARSGDLRIRWTGAADAEPDGDALRLSLTVPDGAAHDLVLELSDRPLGEPVHPARAWSGTEASWATAVPDFDDTVAPRDARHSYAVLRGLTRGGGGMVAAPTLGLPERAEAGRNYDYRYVWLRDQSYAGLAASVRESLPLLDDAVAFATARLLEHGDRLKPAYRVDGTELPDECTLDLPGYPGGRDVVGNWVNDQFQLDTYGELLQLFASAARHDHLTSDGRRAAQLAIRVIGEHWDSPDAGIWELEKQWWTQSRLACVAGLHAIAGQLPAGEGARANALAEKLLAETSRRCLTPDGAWRRSASLDGTDASLLLPPVRGALPANDPRTLATLAAVERTLTQDGYVYRFKPDARPLGEAEGAFLLCGMFMALAQWQQGNHVEAFRWFERNRAACGPPGLLSEEYDVRQRQLRGNLPQGFVHAGLLETAIRLAAPAPTATGLKIRR